MLLLKKEEIDEKDLLYIENFSNMNTTYNLMLNQSTNNLSQISMNQSNKKRIKPPESLTRLDSWEAPVEDWRALVTEDVFEQNLNSSQQQQTQKQPQNQQNTSNVERLAMNIMEMSKQLTTLNIFSDRDSKSVSKNLRIAKSRLRTPVYLRHGPGCSDFGFVTTQDLLQVRHIDINI